MPHTVPTEKMRKQIAHFLPGAIAAAVLSYERFAEQLVPEDVKSFSAHHTACKVAIAHIELLIKLARWASLPDENLKNQSDQAAIAAMITQAQAEVEKFYTENPVIDDAGHEDD